MLMLQQIQLNHHITHLGRFSAFCCTLCGPCSLHIINLQHAHPLNGAYRMHTMAVIHLTTHVPPFFNPSPPNPFLLYGPRSQQPHPITHHHHLHPSSSSSSDCPLARPDSVCPLLQSTTGVNTSAIPVRQASLRTAPQSTHTRHNPPQSLPHCLLLPPHSISATRSRTHPLHARSMRPIETETQPQM